MRKVANVIGFARGHAPLLALCILMLRIHRAPIIVGGESEAATSPSKTQSRALSMQGHKHGIHVNIATFCRGSTSQLTFLPPSLCSSFATAKK